MTDKHKAKTRKTTHKLSAAELLRKHSPIKRGLQIKDEDKPLDKYSKIMSKIYLGNYQAAKDADFFKNKKIKAVLNCTKDIPHHFSNKKDIEYMRIPIDDSIKEVDFNKLYQFLPSIVEFIHKHAGIQKHNIFIHCYAGRQRSAGALGGYLMAKHDMNPGEACKFIMDKRPEAFHFGLSLNFEDSLKKYYRDLQKCKTK
jgi:protein-tyrosine phosphatase